MFFQIKIAFGFFCGILYVHRGLWKLPCCGAFFVLEGTTFRCFILEPSQTSNCYIFVAQLGREFLSWKWLGRRLGEPWTGVCCSRRCLLGWAKAQLGSVGWQRVPPRSRVGGSQKNWPGPANRWSGSLSGAYLILWQFQEASSAPVFREHLAKSPSALQTAIRCYWQRCRTECFLPSLKCFFAS